MLHKLIYYIHRVNIEILTKGIFFLKGCYIFPAYTNIAPKSTPN